MRKAVILIALILSFGAASGQDRAELARRNGFKDIKLGTPIDSIRGAAFKKEIKEKNEFPAKLFEVENAALMSIGEVKVRRIELKTYKDLIYEIGVITDKDTRLMKGMIKSFGQPKYILTTDTYNWLADELSLTFRDYSKNEIKLTYRCYPVLKMMHADKGKKIDDIAEDF
jgi:hypothetical protein